MRTEIEVEQIDGTTSTIANTGVGSRRHLLTQHWSKLSRFLAVVAQFGLIVWIVRSWQLESLALVRLLGLAFVGFIIHHLLPVRFRLSFFATLSIVAVVLGAGHLGPNVFMGWATWKDDDR
jgi:hypothetical protein